MKGPGAYVAPGPFCAWSARRVAKMLFAASNGVGLPRLLKLNLASDGLKQIKFLPYLGFLP